MSEPMSVEAAGQPHTYAPVDPVPVAIIKDLTPERVRAATWGGWQAYQFAGTENQPVRVLRFDERRRRAVITCMAGAAGNIVGNLWIGSDAQVGNGNPAASAAPIVNGISIVVESASDIWCMPDGVHSLTLVILDEIYRT